MDYDRLKHSLMVARKMVEIGTQRGMDEEELRKLFILGYNHDIGYEFGDNHELSGADALASVGFDFVDEVRFHGEPNPVYTSEFLEILKMADMQIDRYGNVVGYDGRLRDISRRYGADSDVYRRAETIVKELQRKSQGI